MFVSHDLRAVAPQGHRSQFIAVIIACMLLTAPLGCAQQDAPQPKIDADAKIQTPVGQNSQANTAGNQTSAGASEHLPADLPLFPDSTVEAAIGPVVEVRSPGTLDVVREFYEPELKKNGWEIVKADASESGAHLRADKDTRRVDIGLFPKSGATHCKIIVSSQEDYIPQNFNFGERG